MFYFHILLVLITCRLVDGQSTLNKYVVIDGIEVLREDYEAFVKDVNRKGNSKKKTREDVEIEMEYELEQQENESIAKHLPHKHHVCKLFVDEFQKRLETSEDEQSIDNQFLNEAFQESCASLTNYTVTRIESFRYKIGKSILRRTFDDVQKRSKVKEWTYNIPTQQIDDPTGEIDRLTDMCDQLIITHNRALMEWWNLHRQEQLFTWFCEQRYLSSKDALVSSDLPSRKKTEL